MGNSALNKGWESWPRCVLVHDLCYNWKLVRDALISQGFFPPLPFTAIMNIAYTKLSM